ncbi:MazG family protein [Clostridium transplantifaecale]|uniref:MazG family protein n=1 Tax=Clostridium transplantifaecale TaxID=2479838 RepID=UPI003C12BD6C
MHQNNESDKKNTDTIGKMDKNAESGKKYTFDDLKDIMRTLRSENGCPWDRRQTHESLIPCLEEEAGEVIDAIRENDPENLCEELGDLLFQVMSHSQIAEEKGLFTIDDVVDGVSAKMIRRHPNVFGDEKVNSAEEGLDLWNRIKSEEKSKKAQKTLTKQG